LSVPDDDLDWEFALSPPPASGRQDRRSKWPRRATKGATRCLSYSAHVAVLEDARLTGQYTFDYRDFLADFSGQFHYLDSNELHVCLQPGPIRNATEHRRHWLTHCCTQVQMGLSIRASATPPAHALLASGQLWCSTPAAARSVASRWELGQTRYHLSRSFIHFFDPSGRGYGRLLMARVAQLDACCDQYLPWKYAMPRRNPWESK
jgi:hypothetical protein